MLGGRRVEDRAGRPVDLPEYTRRHRQRLLIKPNVGSSGEGILLGAEAPALATLVAHEPDAALGNGGLGRLAACFLDAFATLGLPSFGYGLRYEHGMFAQVIQDGRQVELPDEWLRQGNPWELVRPELRYPVGFGGMVHAEGGLRRWTPAEQLIAQAYDFVVPGHGTERVSTLRQWNAQPSSGPMDEIPAGRNGRCRN